EKYESGNVTAKKENSEMRCFSLGREECNRLNLRNDNQPGCNGSNNDYMQGTTINRSLDKLESKL
ncbi:17669_t:CDS:1, partial [Racocetra fulgida]